MFFIRKNQELILKIEAKLQANIDAGQRHLLLGLMRRQIIMAVKFLNWQKSTKMFILIQTQISGYTMMMKRHMKLFSKCKRIIVKILMQFPLHKRKSQTWFLRKNLVL